MRTFRPIPYRTPSHDSLHDTVTASNRLSFSRRSSFSSHTDVRTCALNLHYRFPICAQDSMVIIWLSTVDFETDAVGVMVREQCPAHCPFTLFLAFNVTLLPLTFCAGLSTWKLGGKFKQAYI